MTDARRWSAQLRAITRAPADAVRGARPVEAARELLAKPQGHKYNHGHALVLSGPGGQGGAARLSARGALRIGAGAVTLGCPADAVAEHAAQLTGVMLRPVADAQGLSQALADARINALCLGPGLGLDDRAAGLVAGALASGRAAVLDADALTLLARHRGLCDALHDRCVLTPHGGEFARLFPNIAAAETSGADRKIAAAAQAARQAGCCVVYKGPLTVIASPNSDCRTHDASGECAVPWLATAGAGDVLAGFVTGLLARGFAPEDAAAQAVWLHAACARQFGPGLIAEDLPEALPAVLRDLGVG